MALAITLYYGFVSICLAWMLVPPPSGCPIARAKPAGSGHSNPTHNL
jgi:hypothetical protein